MKIKCVVACTNANGSPAFFPCEVEVTKDEYNLGIHYTKAEDKAKAEDYQGKMLVYETADGPAFLFEHFFPAKKKETPKFAELAWTKHDVKTLRPRWTLKKCEEELNTNEKYIRDRLCELGWDVIDNLIAPKDGHADLR